MPSQAFFCVYMCRPVSACPWRFGLEDDRRCKVYRWWMQTKFYWISFLVHGFGRHSWLFPSEHGPACWKGRVSHRQQNQVGREPESAHQGPSVSDKYSSHSFCRWVSHSLLLLSTSIPLHLPRFFSFLYSPPKSPVFACLHPLVFFLSFFFICNYSNM